jgi:hypothetical protein
MLPEGMALRWGWVIGRRVCGCTLTCFAVLNLSLGMGGTITIDCQYTLPVDSEGEVKRVLVVPNVCKGLLILGR